MPRCMDMSCQIPDSFGRRGVLGHEWELEEWYLPADYTESVPSSGLFVCTCIQ